MTVLRISPDLALPIDAVTSTLIVYGGKGMGKTNFGAVLAEEVSRARRRFSVIDPLGVWYGLAFSADGKGAGIPFVGLGGPKGDIPITPQSGAIVADFVADEAVSTVITLVHSDGRMWTVGERIRFVADYTYRLFERQGDRKVPLMQIIDEAGRFVPQQIPAGSADIARCVGGIEQLTEWGRNVAVGVTLITQRSARMNKSVSELADAMIAFRTVGPRSIDAIIDWLGEHVPRSRTNEVVERLRELPIGTALVVSPGWLGIEKVVAMRARQTYDSSATPSGGAAAVPHGQGSKPDLDKYRSRMAVTIEEAEAKDPAKLRRRIVELERQLAKPAAAPPQVRVETVTERVEVPVMTGPAIAELRRIAAVLEKGAERITKPVEFLAAQLDRIAAAASRPASVIPAAPSGSVSQPDRRRTEAPRLQDRPGETRIPVRDRGNVKETRPAPNAAAQRPGGTTVTGASSDDRPLSAYGRRLLDTLAARHPMRLTRGQLGILSGSSRKSSSFDGAASEIRRRGLAELKSDGYEITDAGWAEIGGQPPAPTSPEELRATWLRALPTAQAALLRALIEAYPEGLTRAELGERAGYSTSSSTFQAAVPGLRKAGLTEESDGAIAAAAVLFS